MRAPEPPWPAGFDEAEDDDVPSRMTGALKFMFGRLGGGWKDAGRPLGRLAWAMFGCWTPGGGAIPGADMPGGGPRERERQALAPSQGHRDRRKRRQAYLDQEEEPCLVDRRRRRDTARSREEPHTGVLEKCIHCQPIPRTL